MIHLARHVCESLFMLSSTGGTRLFRSSSVVKFSPCGQGGTEACFSRGGWHNYLRGAHVEKCLMCSQYIHIFFLPVGHGLDIKHNRITEVDDEKAD